MHKNWFENKKRFIMNRKEKKEEEKMDQNKRRKRAQAFFLVAIVLVFWNLMEGLGGQNKTTVACVGDSITFGTGIKNREENCYPVQLQKLLGTDQYRVGNFGLAGVTVQKKGNAPYWEEELYEKSLKYDADVIVLLLGTNDSKEVNWKNPKTFRKDYLAMVESYEKLSGKPKIILATLPQIFPPASDWEKTVLMNGEIIEEESRIIKEIGKEKDMQVLDLYELTEGKNEWFGADGIHPNKKGAKAIAEAVAQDVENK